MMHFYTRRLLLVIYGSLRTLEDSYPQKGYQPSTGAGLSWKLFFLSTNLSVR